MLVHVLGAEKMPLIFGIVLISNSVGLTAGRALGGKVMFRK